MISLPHEIDAFVSADQLAEQFTEVARQFRRMSGQARVGELTNARYELLHMVHARGTQPMNTIARAVGVTPRSLTDMVDALETSGYLCRRPNPLDRRGVLLELSDAGLAMVRAGQRSRMALAAQIFEPLDDGDRLALFGLLEKISSNGAHGAALPPDASRYQRDGA
ncbi:MAG: transcriptional regulator, MarR family [Pseudonocardiales bacterium]|nr:transcriptional regulator, MarR family [Pseudonocardiales bacterium]